MSVGKERCGHVRVWGRGGVAIRGCGEGEVWPYEGVGKGGAHVCPPI